MTDPHHNDSDPTEDRTAMIIHLQKENLELKKKTLKWLDEVRAWREWSSYWNGVAVERKAKIKELKREIDILVEDERPIEKKHPCQECEERERPK